MSVGATRDTFIKDLQWCLSTQGLLPLALPYQCNAAFFQGWQRDIGSLNAACCPAPNRRLGLYFEQCWRELIRLHPHWDLLLDNVAINTGKRTLGAIDFVVINHHTQQIEHWELAVKFYLGINSAKRVQDFLGPNLNDKLSDKVAKLLLKQLPLGRHACITHALAPYHTYHFRQRILLKGYLFTPWQTEPCTNPWFDMTHFKRHCLKAHWRVLNKVQWLSGNSPKSDEAEPFKTDYNKPLQLMHRTTGQRGFVVPDSWLAHACTKFAQ